MTERTVVPVPLKQQFSLATILLVVLVYAFTFALAVTLPTAQFIAAVFVVTVFVISDLWFHRVESETRPRLARASIFAARYATAFAFSTVACFAVFVLESRFETVTAPPPQASGFAGFAAIGKLFLLIYAYFGVFSLFSMIAFIASLLVIRRFRLAKWLALINFPGTALFCFYIYGIAGATIKLLVS